MFPNDFPFEFKSLKFFIKVCFAIEINTAQEETLTAVGNDMCASWLSLRSMFKNQHKSQTPFDQQKEILKSSLQEALI